ncbi:class I SAM-dependent methyltransferase [Frigidibacter sp. MR17.24]|uniref:class I SAM-dependent methyltransferase n=1 Tax=Frigidibacter sp. MR17.24 TaxID=3127345 RepID=UPI003012C303
MAALNADPLRRGRTLKHDVAEALADELRALGARRVLDIGCGGGMIAGQLVARGFEVTGIDPDAAQIDHARRIAPAARFQAIGIEALPPELGGFDAAIMVNSLHHVPGPAMQPALARALAAAGHLVICEPAAAGSFFRVMQPVEDETAVRAEAVAAIEAVIAARGAELVDLKRWDRETRFDGLEAFVAYLMRADPERERLAQENRASLRRAWRENIELRDGQAVLTQPIICWTLRRAP